MANLRRWLEQVVDRRDAERAPADEVLAHAGELLGEGALDGAQYAAFAEIARAMQQEGAQPSPGHAVRTRKLRTERGASFVPPFFCVLSCSAALIGFFALWSEFRIGFSHGPIMAAGVLGVLFGGAIGYLSAAAWSSGGRFLVVDPVRGTLRYVDFGEERAFLPLTQVGELSIAEQRNRSVRYRSKLVWYELSAQGLPGIVLFWSSKLPVVERRRDLLLRMIAPFESRERAQQLLRSLGA